MKDFFLMLPRYITLPFIVIILLLSLLLEMLGFLFNAVAVILDLLVYRLDEWLPRSE